MAKRTYQEIILALEQYWADYGCVLLTPYHTEVAAGTMNPATFLRSLGPSPWKTNGPVTCCTCMALLGCCVVVRT